MRPPEAEGRLFGGLGAEPPGIWLILAYFGAAGVTRCMGVLHGLKLTNSKFLRLSLPGVTAKIFVDNIVFYKNLMQDVRAAVTSSDFDQG